MFNDINNSFLSQSNSLWGNSGMVNPDLDSWFDIGSDTDSGQWPGGGVGPVIPGGQGNCNCGTQQGWPDWAGQGNCGTQQGWPGYPGQGPGPVQPGCHPDKICVTPQELSHIIEEILESKGNKRCYKGANKMCCSNSGCLGYAPKNNCCYCGYNGYNCSNCNCGSSCGNYSYGNYSYGNDDGLWWIILLFFFGGCCFF